MEKLKVGKKYKIRDYIALCIEHHPKNARNPSEYYIMQYCEYVGEIPTKPNVKRCFDAINSIGQKFRINNEVWHKMLAFGNGQEVE